MQKSAPERRGGIKKVPPPDLTLRFSFRLFDPTDQAMCPKTFNDGYTQALMQRLRDLSSWTVRRFTS